MSRMIAEVETDWFADCGARYRVSDCRKICFESRRNAPKRPQKLQLPNYRGCSARHTPTVYVIYPMRNGQPTITSLNVTWGKLVRPEKYAIDTKCSTEAVPEKAISNVGVDSRGEQVKPSELGLNPLLIQLDSDGIGAIINGCGPICPNNTDVTIHHCAEGCLNGRDINCIPPRVTCAVSGK